MHKCLYFTVFIMCLHACICTCRHVCACAHTLVIIYCVQLRAMCVCVLHRPGFGSCTGACKVTSCRACYYNDSPREIPSGCQQSCNDLTDRPLNNCLSKWGKCIRKQYMMLYSKDQVREKITYIYIYICIRIWGGIKG